MDLVRDQAGERIIKCFAGVAHNINILNPNVCQRVIYSPDVMLCLPLSNELIPFDIWFWFIFLFLRKGLYWNTQLTSQQGHCGVWLNKIIN